MKLVSVCVSVYNREATLRQCLDSIINQTYSNLEILIIDDASNDSSAQIINEYYLKDNRIKTLKNNHNLGPAVCSEILYNKAKGEYLCTVDSDDYITLDCIEDCLTHIGNYGLIYTYCKEFGTVNRLNKRALYPYSKDALLNYFMVFHFRLFKTELWHKVPSFTVKRWCYDYDLVLMLSEVTDFILLPKVKYFWRKHENQETTLFNLENRRREYKLAQDTAKLRRN